MARRQDKGFAEGFSSTFGPTLDTVLRSTLQNLLEKPQRDLATERAQQEIGQADIMNPLMASKTRAEISALDELAGLRNRTPRIGYGDRGALTPKDMLAQVSKLNDDIAKARDSLAKTWDDSEKENLLESIANLESEKAYFNARLNVPKPKGKTQLPAPGAGNLGNGKIKISYNGTEMFIPKERLAEALKSGAKQLK